MEMSEIKGVLKQRLMAVQVTDKRLAKRYRAAAEDPMQLSEEDYRTWGGIRCQMWLLVLRGPAPSHLCRTYLSCRSGATMGGGGSPPGCGGGRCSGSGERSDGAKAKAAAAHGIMAWHGSGRSAARYRHAQGSEDSSGGRDLKTWVPGHPYLGTPKSHVLVYLNKHRTCC
jgi:hypothetical protein